VLIHAAIVDGGGDGVRDAYADDDANEETRRQRPAPVQGAEGADGAIGPPLHQALTWIWDLFAVRKTTQADVSLYG